MKAFLQKHRHALLAAALILFFVLLQPLYLKDYPYRETILTGAFFWAALAAGWSLLAGTAGQFSFAHMAFMAIGAYGAALFERDAGADTLLVGWMFENPDLPLVNFLISDDGSANALFGIIVGAFFAGLIGLFVGALALRLRAAYLALFTIAFSELLRLWLTNEVNLTEGRKGLRIEKLWDGATGRDEYFAMLAVLVGSLVLMQLIIRSRMGLFLRAIREDQNAAITMGVDVVRYKVLVFVITSMLAGVAGAVYYHHIQLLSPDIIMLLQMGTLIAMAVIGGIENIYAAAAGAFVIRILQESLRGEFGVLGQSIELGTWRLAAFGLIMIITLRFAQNGLLFPFIEWFENRAAGRQLSVSIRRQGGEELEA